MSSYSIRVPASTSNLGAGFDALSLALNRYLSVSIEHADDFRIDIRGATAAVPTGPDNLVLRVAQKVAVKRGKQLSPFAMAMDCGIPLARGLGSSAAAIIAGISCYELTMSDRLTDEEIFDCALEFESHPDNLAAALYGGLVAAAVSETGNVVVARVPVAPGATPLAVIPVFELATERARAVLPSSYSRPDVVYNIQRSALAVAALSSGSWSLVREAMRDRIHHPYRAPLVPGLEEILDLEIQGLLGVALSGAGPTVFALTQPECAAAVGEAIVQVFDRCGVKATAAQLEIDTNGRQMNRMP